MTECRRPPPGNATMQRETSDGIVIACDFCGDDWDQLKPMMEGHRGSVICLSCLEAAAGGLAPAPDPFECTLCLRPIEAPAISWSRPDPPATANAAARICEKCIRQATAIFAKDPDVPFEKP